jgi:F-type H+-transporting ATPase subunit b
MNEFIPAAFAHTDGTPHVEAAALPSSHAAETPSPAEHETVATTEAGPAHPEEAAHSGGLSVDPAVVGFQALNFIVLLLVLNMILYKPLTKLLADREKKIQEGVENAEKAEASLREATSIREDMMKNAKVESQSMMEKARKEGEGLKNSMMTEAQDQAKKIIDNGHQVIAMEKAKTMEELKSKAASLIVMTAEKVIREKMDSSKDAKMIEESLNSMSV